MVAIGPFESDLHTGWNNFARVARPARQPSSPQFRNGLLARFTL